ncbi:tetratricopeptide repeat protein [Roseibacillus ishigakijimensis]|uniref:Tetratricopeptide repeat protein n=1 Tax=Roseibacillus ishigakijimensis TaxID=454146 RepID=A0A934RRW1_9BACT|nr:tetratricopeptide repeat protein [Roseibacillus ishigakijimensis]MBK1833391.1 tetratricopeptide repeat protein [Roseibacillus ishigakijimensis]
MEEATGENAFREISVADLEPSIQGYWKKAQESLQIDNHKYAVTLLQAILKEAPGFLEGRKALRMAEDKLTGGPKKKRGLFGTSVGANSPSVSKKYLAQADKDGNAALQAVEKELEKDPFNASFNDALHDVAAKLGMTDTAAFALETVRKAFPEEGKLMHKLAEFYLSVERPLDAAAVYEDIVKANPGDIDAVKKAKDCTARASMLSNRSESGELVLQKKDAEETLALEKASRSALTKEQMEEKRDNLAAQYAADQNNLNVVRDLAAVYENLEDWDNAYAFYDWGFQISNNDVALKNKAGKMKDKAAEVKLSNLKKAVEANPDDAEAARELEEFRSALSAEQVEERKKRVEENPTDPSLRFSLGEALFHAGQYKEAIQHLQQATRNPHIRTKVLILLGRTFDKMGMVDMAVNRFEEANAELKQMDATKKEVLYELGLIFEKQSEKEKAIDSFKQIYEVDYGYRDVAERVESAYQ